MDPVQMSLQTNPKLCDSGSTLYHLLVYKCLCPLLGGHAEASVSCLQQNTAAFLWFLFYAH